ncbi:MAG: fructose-bisphosphatase class II, partial [Deltaproteobacteria bacterium]|nr:fructose-bisphosphatase class II [Deltaproteobacteria bacterium]
HLARIVYSHGLGPFRLLLVPELEDSLEIPSKTFQCRRRQDSFGSFLRGVQFFSGGANTYSVVMRSKSRTIRFSETTHYFEFKPKYD